MAVELKDLYEEIKPQYDVMLHTASCFGKKIGWIHTVEDTDFIPLLHGDELVFNSGLNNVSDEWLLNFIKELNQAHTGGLIVSLRNGHYFSPEVVQYCNEIQFPLFSASWITPYIDIIRKFSEILIKNEQRETSLITAVKNAIYYPKNEDAYISHLETAGFFKNMSYTVIILSCHEYDAPNGNAKLEQIEKSLRYVMKKGVVFEEQGRLVILAAGYQPSVVKDAFRGVCGDDKNIYVGIGSVVSQIQLIHKSYKNADTAYRLTKTAMPQNLLCYDDLGVYKILADVKEENIYPEFVRETLGPLINYDRKNHTDYVHILETYFEHECSVIHTARALYCHKNTLTYKMNKIREVLGYDILTNENRTRIMLAYHIMRMERDV